MFGGTYGVVRDAVSGDAIRNAAVTLSPGNYTYTTGNDGQFQFSDLEAGSYTLRCVASGYNSNSRQITVYAGENIPCDFQMTKQTSVASITISTNSIDFGTTSTEEVFSISNTGNAGTVSWNISKSNAPWLTVTPTSGSTAQGKSSTIILSVDRTKVTKDELTYITINAAGGSHSVAVSVKYSGGSNDPGNDNPKGEAVVGFNTDILDFGTTESELTLLVANLEEATADLNWELGKEYPSCLSFSMTSGKLEPGTYNTVTVRLDRSKMSSDIDTTIKIYDLADNYEYYYPVTVRAKKTTIGGGGNNEDYSTATIKANDCDGFVFNISSCKRSGDNVVMEYTLTNNNSFMAFWAIGSLYNYATDNLNNSYDYKKLKYSLSTKSVNYGEYMQNAPVASNTTAKGTITIKNVDTSATKISIYLVKGTNIWNDDEGKYIYPSTISFENVPIY